MIHDLLAFTPLFFNQSTNTNIKGAVVETPLVLTQVVDQNFESSEIKNRVVFAQAVAVVKVLNLAVAHGLALSQLQLPRITPETAFQFLSIQDIATVESQWPLVRDVLVFVDLAAAEVSKGAYDTLTLAQSVQVNVTKNVSVSQTLTMVVAGHGFLPSYYWTSFPVTVVSP